MFHRQCQPFRETSDAAAASGGFMLGLAPSSFVQAQFRSDMKNHESVRILHNERWNLHSNSEFFLSFWETWSVGRSSQTCTGKLLSPRPPDSAPFGPLGNSYIHRYDSTGGTAHALSAWPDPLEFLGKNHHCLHIGAGEMGW